MNLAVTKILQHTTHDHTPTIITSYKLLTIISIGISIVVLTRATNYDEYATTIYY